MKIPRTRVALLVVLLGCSALLAWRLWPGSERTITVDPALVEAAADAGPSPSAILQPDDPPRTGRARAGAMGK